MVAVQVLLMNYFLLGLHSDHHLSNDVIPNDSVGACSVGCVRCSAINGCMVCKPPLVLVLRRQNSFQLGYCGRSCPRGFFNKYKGIDGTGGICFKCDIAGCRDCSSGKVCTDCNRGYHLEGKVCVRRCDKGFRYDSSCRKCLKIRKEKKQKYVLGCTKHSPLNGCLRCKPPFVLILKRDGFLQKGSCRRCCPKRTNSSLKQDVCIRASDNRNGTVRGVLPATIPATTNATKNDVGKTERQSARKRKRRKKRRKKRRRRKQQKLRRQKQHQLKQRRRKSKNKKVRHCRGRRKRQRKHVVKNVVKNVTALINL